MNIAYNRLQAELGKQVAVTQFGIMIQDYETSRERRLLARLEQRINGTPSTGGVSGTNKGPVTPTSQRGQTDDDKMDVDVPQLADSLEPLVPPTKDEEEIVEGLCQLLFEYLQTFGPLDQKLQVSSCQSELSSPKLTWFTFCILTPNVEDIVLPLNRFNMF